MPFIATIAIWFIWRRPRIKVVITEEFGDMRRIIHEKKRLSMKADKYDYDKGSYTIDLSRAVIDKNNKPILYYQKGNVEPLQFANGSYKSSSLFGKILKNTVYGKFLHSEREKVYIIIMVALIVAIGCISVFSIYTMSNQNNKIMELTNNIAQMLLNQTGSSTVIIK